MTLRRAHWRRLLVLVYAVLTVAAMYLSFLLRFDFTIPRDEYLHLTGGLWLAVALKIPVFWISGTYSSSLEYVSFRELWRVLKANLLASALLAAAALYLLPGFPRSIYCLDLLLCFVFTAGARSSARIYKELSSSGTAGKGRGALIYGAGNAGATVLKEVLGNPSLSYRIVGFLDDNRAKRGLRIFGVPVMGSGRDAAAIVAKLKGTSRAVEEIIIAMPSAHGAQIREALANCRAAGVPCKIVPGVGELLSGRVLTRQIRDVSVLDLLGREPVRLDETHIRHSIEGKTVLVTGGAGSIGSELCRQVARFGPGRLIAFDQSESGLFHLEREMHDKFAGVEFVPQVGDITDLPRIDEVIYKYHVQAVFHAAAYKHVPMMEAHLIEAVRNNVIGTANVIEAAERNRVRQFLMISSDKAVNPANIMGLTKRCAELILSAMRSGAAETRFVSVRFGNVLGSAGSVVPLFQEQIAAGGPVTVTHPDMKRYFMTIPEAVQLVLQASTMGKGSEIFELDMGTPVRIDDLARNMIRLSGHEVDKDIEIRYTGLRPGEKLIEELATDAENVLPTYHEKIKIFCGHSISRSVAQDWLQEMQRLLRLRDEVAILRHMMKIVPEYNPIGYWAECLKAGSVNRTPAALSVATAS